MKNVLKTLALFFVLTIALSSLEGCNDSQAGNSGNGITAKQSDPAKSSNFPPIPAGLAAAEIEALDGTKSKVSDHKGKVLILNLWGIWCGPCRDEMPHLALMQKKYADKGLEVISLNIGDHEGRPEPVENIKKFAEQMKLEYTLARIAGEGVAQFYAISKQQAIPQTIMIDREGRMRGVFVGGGQSVFTSMEQTLDKTMND